MSDAWFRAAVSDTSPTQLMLDDETIVNALTLASCPALTNGQIVAVMIGSGGRYLVLGPYQ